MKKFLISGVAAALAMTSAIPAFADDGAMSSSAMSSSTSSVMMRRGEEKMMKKNMTIDGSCMVTPVDTRDTALMSAFSTLASSVNAALSTRKDALKAAWALTDTTQRNAAVKAAWEAYGKTVRTARNTFKTAKKDAWKAFKVSAKACKIPSADASGESADAQL